MKQIKITYRFLALNLAFLMFFTSLSFNLDVHFCQGKLKSFSFFGKAKNCYELLDDTSMKNCMLHTPKEMKRQDCSIAEKDCCENKSFHIQLQQNQDIHSVIFQIPESLHQLVMAYVATFFSGLIIEQNQNSFERYLPPLIPRDIYVLIQSFLL